MTEAPAPAGVPPVGQARRVGSNIVFSGLGRAWAAVLLFVTVPIVVHGIGTSAYGIFALVSVILGYVAFLDFGLTAAVVRSVAKHRALGDMRGLEGAVGTAFTLLIALGVVGAAAIVLLSPVVAASVLHVPAGLRPDAVFAFQVAGIGFGVNMVLVVFAGVVQGLQRLDIFALRSIILSTLTSAAQIAAVTLGGGLRALVIATVVVSVLGFVVFLAAARRLLPEVSFRPRLHREAVGELAGFGLFRFLNQASGQVTTWMDPVVIGIFQPIAAVALYSVPLAVTQKFHAVEDSVASAYFPAAVEVHTSADVERAKRLYLSALKLVLVAMGFLMVICAGYSFQILQAWVGPAIADRSASIFTVLAIGYGLSALIGIPAQASDATGHQRWTAGFAIASAILQLTLALILVPRYGAIGAAYAVLLNTVTQGAVFVWLVQHRFLRIGALTVFTGAVFRPLPAITGVLVLVLLTRDHAGSGPAMVAWLVLCAVLYAALTLVFRVWSPEEISVGRQMLRAVWALRVREARGAQPNR